MIYLDNSATTRQFDEVTDVMVRAMQEDYGNPSSLYQMGVDAEKAIKAARRQVLADAAYLLWVCTLLMHPVVPRGCEDICAKLAFDADAFFSWDHGFASLAELDDAADHAVLELPPRYDFF